MNKGFHQHILNHILGVVAVLCDPVHNLKYQALMAFAQLQVGPVPTVLCRHYQKLIAEGAHRIGSFWELSSVELKGDLAESDLTYFIGATD